MIVNARAVVIGRRDMGEADRLATLYTQDWGKISVRFVGVSLAKGRLKALAEPIVFAEFRLYMKPHAAIAKAIGGELINTFPTIRSDFDRTIEAMACCEMIDRLTPEQNPNAEKYGLIVSVLEALDRAPSPWLTTSFGLRLLDLAGIGVEAPPDIAPRLWQVLKKDSFDAVTKIPEDQGLAARCRQILESHVEAQAGRALRSRLFRRSLNRVEAPVLT